MYNLQQRDLSVHRMKGFHNRKYQYQLFIKGVFQKTHTSDIEYPYGMVQVDSPEGSVRLTMKELADLKDFSGFTDPNTFLVPVTIKS